MKILQINKFFYRRGGVEVVLFDTIAGLRERGYDVVEFSMQHPKNFPSQYSKYFASEIPELLEITGLKEKWQVFKRFFTSSEIEQKLSALIEKEKPDVAHIHGAYHHLSASTFTTLFKYKIPTLLTLHDFFPLSPSRNFLIKDHLDEKAYQQVFGCVRNKCINDKFLPSLAGEIEACYYKLQGIWKKIDRFICPSEFMRTKMLEYGFAPEKLTLIRNPFTSQIKQYPLGTKIVFLGRIHAEKGIKLFMEACKNWRYLPIIVAGTGPEDAWVDNFIKENSLTNIERYGWVTGEAWQNIMKEAKVIVLPSIFYENCPIAILEAMSYGRIVVASNRGGNPEMIKDGVTGFLAEPENAQDLAQVVRKAINLSPTEVDNMVQEAKKLIEKNYQIKDYLDGLEEVYKEITC